ncbi:hypothetical protein ACFVJ4_40295 [Streptomyces sp. NPDC127178]|uniref:hypothetical protein n=1 Tax=unclassified Streptomyces TaxID=2593676 RepID=UPI00363A277A
MVPETSSSPTELASQYMSQVTSDLERNVKEQERLAAEITALQEQLAVLQKDHGVLDTVRQALSAPAATAQSGTPAVPTVPAPRKTTTAAAAAERKPAKTAAPARPKTAERARKKATAHTKGTASAQPTLVALVEGHLAGQSEPRSAAEITTALSQAHPDREIQTTVVRTTLENLVARSKAHRTKQGHSVFYTAPGTSQAAASPTAAADAEAAK